MNSPEQPQTTSYNETNFSSTRLKGKEAKQQARASGILSYAEDSHNQHRAENPEKYDSQAVRQNCNTPSAGIITTEGRVYIVRSFRPDREIIGGFAVSVDEIVHGAKYSIGDE